MPGPVDVSTAHAVLRCAPPLGETSYAAISHALWRLEEHTMHEDLLSFSLPQTTPALATRSVRKVSALS